MHAGQDLAATGTGASSDTPDSSGRLSVKVAEHAVLLFCGFQIKSFELLEIGPKVFHISGTSHCINLCGLHHFQIKLPQKFILGKSCDDFGNRTHLSRRQDVCWPVPHELPRIGDFFSERPVSFLGAFGSESNACNTLFRAMFPNSRCAFSNTSLSCGFKFSNFPALMTFSMISTFLVFQL